MNKVVNQPIGALPRHPGQESPARKTEKVALSVPQVAEALSIGVSQAWKLVNTGVLPSFRVGRRVLVSKASLQEWVARAERGAA
jgi:excisionase family DNA binding protein